MVVDQSKEVWIRINH